MKAFDPLRRRHFLIIFGLVLLAGGLQLAMGRIWWCACGQANLWSGDITSMHNSQHLLDAYTFTHILHGIGFYALIWLVFHRVAGRAARLVFAVGLESAWEVIENTSLVIERYRTATISLGYYGDSIANSMADIAACAGGYLLAMWLPVWASITIFCSLEAALLWWIRDSLLLNILMLIYPFEAIKDWQMGRGS